jgi:cell division protein FtsB
MFSKPQSISKLKQRREILEKRMQRLKNEREKELHLAEKSQDWKHYQYVEKKSFELEREIVKLDEKIENLERKEE